MTITSTPTSRAPKSRRRKGPLRRALGVVLVLLLVVLATVIGFVSSGLFAAAQTSDSQIYQSVQRQEKVALLALSIQGISRQEADGSILGIPAPAGDRTTIIQYAFTAQVGIDGSHATIEAAGDGEGSYVVSIPEFIFIGYDDPRFEDAIESNGPLSFLTEEVEVTEMINNILSEENQQTYIEDHAEILRDQAEAYYTGIIQGIDPDATLTFEFAS
ncbi:hypothetical protein NQ166_00480 [Microbacterium sp. zg.Y1090]|uniref:hypothetical protein n=1 Tax=Microbacterium wangruii TaxID=3049073 RepID=UPI00214B3EC7|nr:MULTISPECIES: hypothetical protein [unclassified Microbacterium]MCR2817305.1 hypothetical protein [Microbacterium sp. zg.Y1090]WIM29207.1 hypothetical protein QNO26_04730 [Microbacterium sp. zg-Y1090]